MQMIGLNDAKQDEAHKRLRRDLDDVERQIDGGLQAVRQEMALLNGRMDVLEKIPVDATKLVLAPRVVVAITMIVLSIAGSVWFSTAGLRSDVRDVLTRMDLASELEKVQSKSQEERAAALKAAVEAVQRDQRMTQYDVQGLKEALLKMQGTKGQ
jgi:small-conductance mechanosensitive channel